jgi:hypothetical protein
LECWRLDSRILVGELRDSVRMKGERRVDEHSRAAKLLPSDSQPKKSCTEDRDVQYDWVIPLVVSLSVTEVTPWQLMMAEGSPTFINLSNRWWNVPQLIGGLLQVGMYKSRLGYNELELRI